MYFRNMNIRPSLPIVVAFVLSAGCASGPSQQRVPKWVETYYSQIRNEIEPSWGDKTKQEIKKLRASGLTVQQLQAPENTVKIEFGVSRSGKVEDVKTLQRSKYSFLNEVALRTVNEIESLPSPPAECFKDGYCKIRWDFILATK